MAATSFPWKLWCTFVFLCCSSSSSSHTPVSSNSTRSVITHLPGFQGRLPFYLQTGYVEVDKSNGVRLFYYFIRSERSPADDPLMLWVTGGPGCSVLTALTYEIGPLRFEVNSYIDGVPRLVHKKDSWTKVSNVIFLDSPVGTGFSYSDTEKGYQSSDTKAVNQILIFLKKWFDEHPEFLSNSLYIAVYSHSGKIVPAVTSKIARGKEVGSEPNYNLKGYLVGNPVTDINFDEPSKIPFAHGMDLVSDEMYEAYTKRSSVGDNSQQSIECTNSIDAIDECIKDICTNHVLEPLCTDDSLRRYKLKPKLNSGALEMLQHQAYISDAEIRLSEISSQ